MSDIFLSYIAEQQGIASSLSDIVQGFMSGKTVFMADRWTHQRGRKLARHDQVRARAGQGGPLDDEPAFDQEAVDSLRSRSRLDQRSSIRCAMERG
jgi:hypothetical protein